LLVPFGLVPFGLVPFGLVPFGLASLFLTACTTADTEAEGATGAAAQAVSNVGDVTCVTVRRDTLGQVEDALLSVDAPSWKTGSEPSLYTGRSGGGACCNESLVRFDLSFLPAGAAVVSATLRLQLSWSAEPGLLRVHRVLQPWSESTVSRLALSGSFAFDPTVAASFAIAPGDVGEEVVDVTALTKGWVSSPAQNHGLLLEEDSSAAHLFWSSETSRKPALDVCFTPASAPPGGGAPGSPNDPPGGGSPNDPPGGGSPNDPPGGDPPPPGDPPGGGAESPAGCDNGFLDVGEADIDCGGPCAPCPDAPCEDCLICPEKPECQPDPPGDPPPELPLCGESCGEECIWAAPDCRCPDGWLPNDGVCFPPPPLDCGDPEHPHASDPGRGCPEHPTCEDRNDCGEYCLGPCDSGCQTKRYHAGFFVTPYVVEGTGPFGRHQGIEMIGAVAAFDARYTLDEGSELLPFLKEQLAWPTELFPASGLPADVEGDLVPSIAARNHPYCGASLWLDTPLSNHGRPMERSAVYAGNREEVEEVDSSDVPPSVWLDPMSTAPGGGAWFAGLKACMKAIPNGYCDQVCGNCSYVLPDAALALSQPDWLSEPGNSVYSNPSGASYYGGRSEDGSTMTSWTHDGAFLANPFTHCANASPGGTDEVQVVKDISGRFGHNSNTDAAAAFAAFQECKDFPLLGAVAGASACGVCGTTVSPGKQDPCAAHSNNATPWWSETSPSVFSDSVPAIPDDAETVSGGAAPRCRWGSKFPVYGM